MIRRRRPQREIAFSFDSFLDLVANVVGIIIRLILVVWVGARSYGTMHPAEKPIVPPPPAATSTETEDPLQDELARSRRDLEEAQAQLMAQLRELGHFQSYVAQTQDELKGLVLREGDLSSQSASLDKIANEHRQAETMATLSVEDLKSRSAKLRQAMRDLQAQPSLKKTLRYRTPVSQPVQSEEIMFECRHGKVAFIDVQALIDQMQRGLETKAQLLRTQWQIRDVAGPVGPFQMKYILERERGPFESVLAATGPDSNTSFRYGVSTWQIEPVTLTYGETTEAALKADSDFRQVVDHLDPRETAVTFWVYPDSFGVFRQVRDYLYERDIMVAGRPLPEGIPITSSRQGSVSRGQ
jgi:hypothetical protein